MFPVEDLLGSLELVEYTLKNARYTEEKEQAVLDLVEALKKYFEWKQKPFMEAMSKPTGDK